MEKLDLPVVWSRLHTHRVLSANRESQVYAALSYARTCFYCRVQQQVRLQAP